MKLFIRIVIAFLPVFAMAQSINIPLKGVETIRYNEKGIPSFVKFAENNQPNYADMIAVCKQLFSLQEDESLSLMRTETDELGITHSRFQEYKSGQIVEDAIIIIHHKNNRIISINGNYIKGIIQGGSVAKLDEANGLDFALKYVKADKYKWEIPGEETWLKTTENNADATYYPKGELVWMTTETKNLKLAWKFNVYAEEPLSRQEIYVDAYNGSIIQTENLLFDANSKATAYTRYNGTQTITTDSVSKTQFRLRETGRGNGIETYNLQQTTSYASAVDFLDSNNIWNNVNTAQDEVATDAQYGAEMTWDFYSNILKRNSYNGYGAKILSYVHYSKAYNNAFWDGQRMTYGDGNGSVFTPLTGMDVCGHEISHGMTQYTAGLNYSNESGALNESFSDVFGTAIEFYARKGKGDYLIGKEITPSGNGLRGMANPNAYGDPAYYKGKNWYSGTADNGGVHTNSGVQNYWFYLLSNGAKGTNEVGKNYDIKALGTDVTARIAYRSLSTYLTPTSNYNDARFYSIQAARDLFGNCSNEEKQCTNAWYAAGVGNAYDSVLKADFISNKTEFCKPNATVSFINASTAAVSFSWKFGDGGTSTSPNPTHTYTSYGKFNVEMIATGCTGGTDTITKTAFITVDSNFNLCKAVFIPKYGYGIKQTSCTGTVYDDGADSNYSANTQGIITIAPTNAALVKLTFKSFGYEDGFDYLYVYDGTSVSAPLIGKYTGFNLPNGGIIVVKSGAVTLRQVTDPYKEESGFEASWQCVQKSPNDAGIYSVKSLRSGRQNTSIALTNSERVVVTIKNYGTNTIQKMPVAYSVNGGAAVIDTFKGSLTSGAVDSFVFTTKADLSSSGVYSFNFWTMLNNDTTLINDSLTQFTVRHIANNPIALPFNEDFENTGKDVYQDAFLGMTGAEKFDYSNTAIEGRLRTYGGAEFPIGGNRSVILDKSPSGGTQITNYMTLTLNLAKYKYNQLYLDFNYMNDGQAYNIYDKVMVRGNDKAIWVELYDLYVNRPAAGSISKVVKLDISAKLKAAGQSVSTSTQIRFSQYGSSTCQGPGYFNGYTLDDIRVWSPFPIDLGISSLVSPVIGRQYTSIALKTNEPITMYVVNYGTQKQDTIKVAYQADNGPIVHEKTSYGISPGVYQGYSFKTTANLSDSGWHRIKIWTENANDSAAQNDTLVSWVRQIPNEPASLPYLQGFENCGADAYQKKTIGISGAEQLDFENSDIYGRLRTAANSSFYSSGSHAATLDHNNNNGVKFKNYLILTLNLSKHTLSNLYLDFDYLSHGEEEDSGDRVWFRGSDQDPWITLYDLFKNKATDGTYKKVTDLDLNAALAKKGQKVSTSSQLRFGQEDNGAATDLTQGDGFTFDNIRVWGVTNDLGVYSIDGPVGGCGLTSTEPVKIHIKNYGSVLTYVTPIYYSLNGGTPVADTSRVPLFANDTVAFTFGKTINLATPGTYTLKVWTGISNDIDATNDTLTTTIIAKNGIKLNPVIKPSGSAAVCEGDSLLLDAGSGYATYQWTTGATTQTIYVKDAGKYNVVVANASGCSAAATEVVVFQNPKPAKPLVVSQGDSLTATYAFSYTWNKDGVPTAMNTRTIKPKQSGKYSVTIMDGKGCTNTSDEVLFTVTVGIGGNENMNYLEVYPNPNHGIFEINYNIAGESGMNITLKNVLGETVYSGRTSEQKGSQVLNVEHLAKGIYILTCKSRETEVRKKVILE